MGVGVFIQMPVPRVIIHVWVDSYVFAHVCMRIPQIVFVDALRLCHTVSVCCTVNRWQECIQRARRV